MKENNFYNEFKQICEESSAIGANIVIANENDVLESHSYGYRDLENKLPTDDKTIYRIASISKTIGAIGLMQLVEAGKIDLDEDISKYLGYVVRNPYYPEVPITVKMLTLQTSSILDGYDDEDPTFDNIRRGYNGVNGYSVDVTLKELLTCSSSPYYTDKTYGQYKPGTRFNYSNFGCGIMACIIEKVSGEYYTDYMENHLFKPLGLDASFRAKNINDKENIANMYSKSSNGLRTYEKERFINSTLKRYPLGDNYRGPAGGLFISMKDLSKIMQTLLNYGTLNGTRILSRELVEEMYQIHWCGNPKDDYNAKGIQMKILNDIPGFPLRGHTGGAYGVRSYMFFSLKHKIGGCFITNGLNAENESIACKNIFLKTQKLFLNKYVTFANMPTTIIVEKNNILLEERKIVANDLFVGKFIKAMSFADMMNTVGIYDEDSINFTITINNKTITIENVVVYKDNLYIDFEKTLNDFEILYTKKEDKYIIKNVIS